MSTLTRISIIIGTILTIVGSFLPWRREGDFISYYYPGIRIFPSFHDYGGLIIVFLSIALVVMVFRPPDFIDRPTIWSIVICVALALTSVFHIVKWLVNWVSAIGAIGATVIQIGLIMVFIGSMILLLISILQHMKSIQ